jgi:hypothetical protein
MYSGFLEWKGERSDIEVIRLILRDAGVQFHFRTSWGDAAEIYFVEGFAESLGGGSFASAPLSCVDRTGYHYPATSKIDLCVLEASPTEVSIAGTWCERPGKVDEETHEFSGLLQKVEQLQGRAVEPFPTRPPIPLRRPPG